MCRIQTRDVQEGVGHRGSQPSATARTTAALTWEAEAVWSMWSVIWTSVLPKVGVLIRVSIVVKKHHDHGTLIKANI